MSIIIYHNVKPNVPCADGFAAAWVARKALPLARLVGCCYGDPLPEIADDEEVVIVDFSFPKDLLESLAARNCKVTVIDHHKTAWENLADLSSQINQRFDMKECGATLTWAYFFPDVPVPAFLLYTKDRDLWQHQLPLTHEIHAALSKLGRSFTLLDLLEPVSQADLGLIFGPFGAKLLKEKLELVKSICARATAYIIELPPPSSSQYEVPGVSLAADGSEDYLTSDICAELYTNLYPEADFVLCASKDGTYSLRSNQYGKNFDVGNLAKALGGGGHRNSSGFKTKVV